MVKRKKVLRRILLIALIILALWKIIDSVSQYNKKSVENTSEQTVDSEIKSIAPVALNEELEFLRKGEMGNLTSNIDALVTNTKVAVKFRISANFDSDAAIDLYQEDKLIGQMKDDGSNGDDLAGDGFYTLYAEVKAPDAVESVTFTAKADSVTSNSLILKAYSKIDNETAEKIDNAITDLGKIEKKYAQDGYVPDDKKNIFIEDLYNTSVESIASQGLKTERIEKTDQGIKVLFSNGVQYVYLMKSKEDEEGGDNVYLHVNRIEPYATTGTSLPRFDDVVKNLYSVKGTGGNIVLEDTGVTFDNIQQAFQPDSFIIWHGHGYYDDNKSYVVTGEEYTLKKDMQYTVDLLTKRMIIMGGSDFDRFAVSYEWFDKHIGSLENSFVYLGGCHTGQDRYLMGVMCWKGADAVVGFSDSVKTKYDKGIFNEMTRIMTEVNDYSGRLYTVDAAIYNARIVHGGDDGDDTPAEPIIMGNPEYRLDDHFPDELKINALPAELEELTNDESEKKLADLEKGVDDAKNKVKDGVDDAKDKSKQAADNVINDAKQNILDYLKSLLNNALNTILNELGSCANC